MSLVQTSRSNAVNPFDYMMAVAANAAAAQADPANWMPWNYHTALRTPTARTRRMGRHKNWIQDAVRVSGRIVIRRPIGHKA